MSARERVMSIRLFEKLAKHPTYAASIGIECVSEADIPDDVGKPP